MVQIVLVNVIPLRLCSWCHNVKHYWLNAVKVRAVPVVSMQVLFVTDIDIFPCSKKTT